MSTDKWDRLFETGRLLPHKQSLAKARLRLAVALPLILTPLCCLGAENTSKVKVEPVIALKAEPFSLWDVRLLESPFRHAMELDCNYLLSLEPDRLLHSFRLNAGIESVAKPYGGWMTPGHTGCAEFVGHYMSACATMYASTGDERLKQRLLQVVEGLGECQKKLETGYLHTKPDNFTTRAEAPLGLWYQIHKLMAGLLEVYVYCDAPQALEISRKMADWAKAGTDKLTDERMQRMLEIEHGGINEALANLYGFTGEEKYLKLAMRFNHMEVIGPASQQQDNLDGKHANTQIPKFTGAAREYELSGQRSLRTAAQFFWNSVATERSYAIGGNSIGEMFSATAKLSDALGPNTCETCNTYNMLKLTRHLFCWEPKAEYADFYERALYNHILASQNPINGMVCYFLPLASGRKEYCTQEDTFWCCTGTGVENHAKYGDSIYFRQGQTNLFVNLFIPSELRWPAVGLTLRQETRYPDGGRTRLIFSCEKPVELRVNIRHPYWATAGFKITFNGVAQSDDSRPGTYVAVSRKWKNKDVLEVEMPFGLHTDAFPDNPRRAAVMYGPLVLCAEWEKPDGLSFPALITETGRLDSLLEPIPGKACNFRGSGRDVRLGDDANAEAAFQPIHTMHGNRKYVVYWDLFTPDAWRTNEIQTRALNARTVDRVLPGREPSEREHHVRGDKTGTDGNRWRDAWDGGWFAWDLKTRPNQAQELCVKYWGGDTGGREFDILVDDTQLATVKLDNNKPGEYYEETYALPAQLIGKKNVVTVRFQAHSGKGAGGVFGCAVLLPQPEQPR